MDKEVVVYIHNAILLSYKKEHIWVISNEVDETIIQSEVSQKEKHQHSILTHRSGILKDGNDDSICKTAEETQM